jgi:ribose transport system substrate-binding protein
MSTHSEDSPASTSRSAPDAMRAAARISRADLLRAGGRLALGGSLLGSLAAAGCGSGSSSDSKAASGSGKPGAGKTIGVDISGTTEYNLCVLTGVMKTLENSGYKLVVRQAAFNAAKEVSNLEDLVTRRVDGILILPTTMASATRGVLRAKAAGIPAVNMFWVGETPGDDGYVGVVETDNIEGGRLVCEYLAKQQPDGSKILIVTGTPGQGFSEQFTAGIRKYLPHNSKILQIGNGNYVRSTSIDVTQTMLTAHPDANTIVTYSAGMADGVASYLSKVKRKDILHVASDADQEMIKWLDDGWIAATRYLSAAETGVIATKILRDYLEHRAKPASFVTKQPSEMVSRSDLSGHPPAPGVVNPDLKAALGVFCYEQYKQRAAAA